MSDEQFHIFVITKEEVEHEKRKTILDVLHGPVLRRRLFITFFLRLVVSRKLVLSSTAEYLSAYHGL